MEILSEFPSVKSRTQSFLKTGEGDFVLGPSPRLCVDLYLIIQPPGGIYPCMLYLKLILSTLAIRWFKIHPKAIKETAKQQQQQWKMWSHVLTDNEPLLNITQEKCRSHRTPRPRRRGRGHAQWCRHRLKAPVERLKQAVLCFRPFGDNLTHTHEKKIF